MKNQYVGDIGDYGKYSLLRFLSQQGITVGINWYLTRNDGSSDGKFTNYLSAPCDKVFDPVVYDALKTIVDRYKPCLRTVQMVQRIELIPSACYFDEEIPVNALTPKERAQARDCWFLRSKDSLKNCDLIFADPDNGITYSKTAKRKGAEKFILPNEVVRYYSEGKDVVFYCHKGRRTQEKWERDKTAMNQYIAEAKIMVLTFHRGTQRSYIFILHPEHAADYDSILNEFVVKKWKNSKAFSREVIINSAGDKNLFRPLGTGFAAPLFGSVYPKGSQIKRNEDGTITVCLPDTETIV
ncbi:MAG: hypothetical protein J5496_07890 [Lachnospiraceae bacterium]|nr:hypothetical protein [Lachnospiraceae bacterium]